MGSCFTAAAEHKMLTPHPVVTHVTCDRRIKFQDRIRFHRRLIHPAEIQRLDGLPLTSPAQTVFDLSATLGSTPLRKVANQGFVEKVLTITELRAVLSRNAGRTGARRFRLLLDRLDPHGRRVDSPLEVRLNDFLRDRKLPPWESNVTLRIGGELRRPDVLWRSQRVIVEADGRAPHMAPDTFDSDRRKDRRARVEGWEPVRVTSADLDFRPDELEADLRTLLGL